MTKFKMFKFKPCTEITLNYQKPKDTHSGYKYYLKRLILDLSLNITVNWRIKIFKHSFNFRIFPSQFCSYKTRELMK